MALISLNIEIVKYGSTVTMQVGALDNTEYYYTFINVNWIGQYIIIIPIHYQFDGSMLICDVHQYLSERLPYIDQGQCKQNYNNIW
jgi:hypothetical protein